jgi:hypothetical protein
MGWGGSLEIPKIIKWKRRNHILNKIIPIKHKMDRIAFFCHGWPKSFDAGFDVSNVNILGKAIKNIASEDCRIYLFCCKTGKLKDGIAAKLAESSGLPVFAHSTSGRAVRNPYKWLFHNGERYPLFPDPKNKELWNHHKLEVESDPFGFYERVEL